MVSPFFLLLIVFLEGYAVLSAELLAIRLMLPFTGSGTDTVSIIIAAVLLPLACGYYAGGLQKKSALFKTVRDRLVFNFTAAAVILTPGLSYIALNGFYDTLRDVPGFDNRLIVTALYAAIFLVIPVFLLGQTIPLVLAYFRRGQSSSVAGRVLFFSTLGSFMGAVFCTLVLMMYLGVHHAASITVGCLVACALILTRRAQARKTLPALLALAAMLYLNSDHAMSDRHIVSNNLYNTARAFDNGQLRTLYLNRSLAAGAYADRDEAPFHYIQFMEEHFIAPLADGPPRAILVLGAGGFTLGRNDRKNTYTYVDIDPALQNIAEQKILGKPLDENKTFKPVEVRAFLNQTDETYDLILIDLYRDPLSMPEYTVTREFFEDIRSRLKPGGIMAGNYILSPRFADDFSVILDNTIRSVFPNLNRQIMLPYDPRSTDSLVNIIYSAKHNPSAPDGIYTDNKNRSAFDRPAKIPE